ncbi:hypothetical protein TL16_g07221 [Triparma laevis f. inornata]|uniref:HTH TFE/IIEalpha-type domain-containing protein n=1 Tax=Triparma laevis f. inornata TaxID=1714386 RepID=A0A9W7AWP4_9STRA|nr:hypothetical protein TL16_g07221 [Triparma laevis f. inornata]
MSANGLCTVDQDFTSTAEELIKAVTRAFYSDNDVFLIDVLIRDKFLRDDTDMETRLKIDSKILRKRLNFLIEERLVSKEKVDDLTDGGSASTTFYYIDYYLVVQIISWRLHLMRTAIEKENEDDKKSASSLVCPNCEGSFQPIDYANWMDLELGAIVCGDCKYENENVVEAIPKTEYVLEQAEQDGGTGGKAKSELDRLKRQTSKRCFPGGGKVIMRSGIMELLQRVRSSKIPLSSNRPSDNHARGRGSKRIGGTGKTAALKAKRDKEEGLISGGQKKTTRDSVLYAKDAEGKDTEIVFGTAGGIMGEAEDDDFGRTLKNAQKRDQEDFRKEAKNLAREQKILGKKSGQTAQGLEHLNADDVRGNDEDEEEVRRRKRAKMVGEEKTLGIKSRQEELLREKERKEEHDRQYQLLLKAKKKELGLEDSGDSSSSDDDEDSDEEEDGEGGAEDMMEMEVDDNVKKEDGDDSDSDSDGVNWEDDG